MIYDKLYDWQKSLVDKIKDKDAYGLWLDCGLGKTPISLALAEINKCNKILVITLTSKVMESDASSFEGWSANLTPSYEFIRLTGSAKATPVWDSSPTICITNYEYLYNRDKKKVLSIRKEILNFIKSCKNQNTCIILDESHEIKNSSATQTKAVNKIYNLVKAYAANTKLYLLSGTPFTNGYIDLYSQLNLMGLNWTKERFKSEFCIMGHIHGLLDWQQPIVGYRNEDKLFELVHQYAVTIDSKDVLTLPEQVFNHYLIPNSKEFNELTLEKIDRKINLKYRNLTYPDRTYLADTPGALWLRARQINIGFQGNAEDSIWYNRSRLKALEEFLDKHPDNYVLFYNYVPELLELFDICEKLDYKIDVFSGDIKSLAYYEQYAKMNPVDKIQNKKRIILSNFASGSTGKNWQEYNKCIIFSLPVYKDWAQGIKRLHRVGQNNTVIYYVFHSNNWLDNGMFESLMEKKDYNEDLFKRGLSEWNQER